MYITNLNIYFCIYVTIKLTVSLINLLTFNFVLLLLIILGIIDDIETKQSYARVDER